MTITPWVLADPTLDTWTLTSVGTLALMLQT